MKITFDSNVWRHVCSSAVFPNDNSIEDFIKIKQAITENKIDPFISETVFTIEAIKRKERKTFLGSRKVKIDTEETEQDDGWLGLTFTLRPQKGIDFSENPILKRHFDDAMKLKFKIARLPRIGGLINEEIERVRFILTGDELTKYLNKVFEVGEKIESAGAGIAHIKSIGKKYDPVWFKGLKKAPEQETGNIATSAAEWADGDSIAVCIALGCDFFCTRDEAKSAGEKSVLSPKNIAWLKSDYGLEIISPEELAKLI